MKYYIATGAQSKMYTLRQSVWVPTTYGGYQKEEYIKTLSQDLAQAQAKAKAYCKVVEDLPVRMITTAKRNKPSETDHTILKCGKFKGSTIDAVAAIDPLWLVYVADNVASMAPKQRNLILSHDLVVKAVKDKIEEEEAKRQARLAKEELWEQENQKKRETSEWCGTVGVRQSFIGRVTFITSGEGQYGTWYLTVAEDLSGNVLTYFNLLNVKPTNDYSAGKGDLVSFDAMVKKHDERDGIKQTALGRATKVKMVEVADDNKELWEICSLN